MSSSTVHVKEGNLFLSLVDTINAFYFHFNSNLFCSEFLNAYLNLVFVIGRFKFEVVLRVDRYFLVLGRNNR